MTDEIPAGWRPSPDADDVEAALQAVDAEAANHNAEYAAGMRHARLIFEETLGDPDR